MYPKLSLLTHAPTPLCLQNGELVYVPINLSLLRNREASEKLIYPYPRKAQKVRIPGSFDPPAKTRRRQLNRTGLPFHPRPVHERVNRKYHSLNTVMSDYFEVEETSERFFHTNKSI